MRACDGPEGGVRGMRSACDWAYKSKAPPIPDATPSNTPLLFRECASTHVRPHNYYKKVNSSIAFFLCVLVCPSVRPSVRVCVFVRAVRSGFCVPRICCCAVRETRRKQRSRRFNGIACIQLYNSLQLRACWWLLARIDNLNAHRHATAGVHTHTLTHTRSVRYSLWRL